MKRAAFFLLAILCASPFALGQNVGVSVIASVPEAKFIVDGTIHTGFASFSWPVGSKHLLTVPRDPNGNDIQYSASNTSQYVFSGWMTSPTALPAGRDFVLTATPDVTNVAAVFGVSHRVQIQLVDPAVGGGGECGSPGSIPNSSLRAGVVYVAGACYAATSVVYLPASGAVPVSAFPYPGFVFRGFSFNGVPVNTASGSITINGPGVLSPMFEPGRRVRFVTEPLGLRVLVDRTEVPTPNQLPCPGNLTLPPSAPVGIQPLCFGEFDFAGGSQHLLGAPTPQQDSLGRWWIFDSFSIGGGQNTVYSTPVQTNTSDTITAKFVRGGQVSLLTSPSGLKLNVDGRENWPSYNFIWGQGNEHDVTAPAEQFDAQGRKYVFKSWSNGGPAAQRVAVDSAAVEAGGIRLIATYEATPRIVLMSSGPIVRVRVGDAECPTPCNLDRPAGTELAVSIPAVIPISEVSRWELQGWHDGAPAQRVLAFNSDHQTFHAIYRQANKLTVVVDPAGGADIKTAPESPDGFFPATGQVTIVAEAKPGYKFRRWEGDLDGTARLGIVSMNAPRIVRAQMDKVPYIAPAGVKNAAGDTPETAVAPGSIISIYGASLANQLEVGPQNPLAQTLAGTVVRLGDRLLPLVYVSPEQINAVLPSDLTPGHYTLMVRTIGLPDVSAEFDITRNAPGLFSNTVEGQPLVLALHEDGTPVTAGSPARRNETVTLLGTGFGPYNRNAPDGFLVPASPQISAVDPVEVDAQGTVLSPAWAGAVPGFTGVAGVRLRLPSAIPSGLVNLHVNVNGKPSNSVVLPLE